MKIGDKISPSQLDVLKDSPVSSSMFNINPSPLTSITKVAGNLKIKKLAMPCATASAVRT